MRPSPSLAVRLGAHVARHDARHVARLDAQQPVRAAYYRGGTSRAVVFQPRHLPRDRALWPRLFAHVMGSGDAYGRQLDGMGAGVSSLSKVCLVEKHTPVAPDAASDHDRIDVDYTFVGLGIDDDAVDVAGNCGNMTSAVGPYAYNARLLPPHLYAQPSGPVAVRIRNTNTAKLITATFDVAGGQAAVAGDCTVDGVSGSGARIRLDFDAPYGSSTGRVLPTGNRVDRILDHRVTCLDGANPCVFIRAGDVGIDGTILPADLAALPDKLALLDRIRRAAAVAMGIAAAPDAVPRTVPKIGLVSMSAEHHTLSGRTLHTAQADLVVRFLSDGQPHRAIPLTAALTTAVAARIPGTLVEQLLAPDPVTEGLITIGHPSGRLHVDATMHDTDPIVPVNATVYRTAKRLFEGDVFWLDSHAPRDPAFGAHGTHSLGMAFVLESRGQSTDPLFGQDVQTIDPELEALGFGRVRKYTSTHKGTQQGTQRGTTYEGTQQGTHRGTTCEGTQQGTHRGTTYEGTLRGTTYEAGTTSKSTPKVIPSTPTSTSTPKVNPFTSTPESMPSTTHPFPKPHPWHAWAKVHAKSKKSLRNAAKKRDKKEKQAAAGVKPTTRRELGIDKWGRTYVSILAKRERKARRQARDGDMTAEGAEGAEDAGAEDAEGAERVERVQREMRKRYAEREARWAKLEQGNVGVDGGK